MGVLPGCYWRQGFDVMLSLFPRRRFLSFPPFVTIDTCNDLPNLVATCCLRFVNIFLALDTAGDRQTPLPYAWDQNTSFEVGCDASRNTLVLEASCLDI